MRKQAISDLPPTPQDSISAKSRSGSSNTNEGGDGDEDDKFGTSTVKSGAPSDQDLPRGGIKSIDQGQHNGTVMVEQDQSFHQQEDPKGNEKRKSLSAGTIENENSFTASEGMPTPLTSFQTSVSQKEFTDLRKADPVAAMRLVMENNRSSSTQTQGTL